MGNFLIGGFLLVALICSVFFTIIIVVAQWTCWEYTVREFMRGEHSTRFFLFLMIPLVGPVILVYEVVYLHYIVPFLKQLKDRW